MKVDKKKENEIKKRKLIILLYKLNSKFIKRNFHSNSSRRTSSALRCSSTITSEVQLVPAVGAFAYILRLYFVMNETMYLCFTFSYV